METQRAETVTPNELAPIAAEIWQLKYRLKDSAGRPVDADIPATWRRVASALAAVEQEPGLWQPRFETALQDFGFLPAGRILSGAGADRSVTMFNCFVMGTIPDDMSGIFESLREAALTMQQGGGIGYDFSTLRPNGAPVVRVGADASGPLSFMDVWDAMCRTIMSAGSRRGAMMAVMRCDHPDIEAFIEAKREPNRLRMFNLSVLVTDKFMEAVKADAPWDLTFGGDVYATVNARELWDKIMQATFAYAEPGVIFIDRINARNNLHYCETIHATNPCGEQPLPPYGACLLGSINLAKLVENPFTEEARLDEERLADLVRIAIRMLDNVIDASNFPLPQQNIEAKAKRRIGLGVTGLADALIMCRARYGSGPALRLVEKWMRAIQRHAYLASIGLARERGPFELFDRNAFLAGAGIAELDQDIRDGIAEHGIRNALLTSIAPTGTISLFAENVASGIEPVFSFTYGRMVLNNAGERQSRSVENYAYRLFRRLYGDDEPLPDYFVETDDLAPDDHIAVQAVAQKYIDASISKTINVPSDIDFEDFKSVYLNAYEQGCKGCTTYRPNDITGSVLFKQEPKPSDVTTVETPSFANLSEPLQRPSSVPGQTYKLRWPENEHAMYVTINDIIDGQQRRPFEIFINSKNLEHYAWTVALTRMISAVFRRGGDIAFVVEELCAVFDPRGGQWMPREGSKKSEYVPSILALIGRTIERHMRDTGFLPAAVDMDLPAPEVMEGAMVESLEGMPSGIRRSIVSLICPKCSQASMINQGGCPTCSSCGYSKCE